MCNYILAVSWEDDDFSFLEQNLLLKHGGRGITYLPARVANVLNKTRWTYLGACMDPAKPRVGKRGLLANPTSSFLFSEAMSYKKNQNKDSIRFVNYFATSIKAPLSGTKH